MPAQTPATIRSSVDLYRRRGPGSGGGGAAPPVAAKLAVGASEGSGAGVVVLSSSCVSMGVKRAGRGARRPLGIVPKGRPRGAPGGRIGTPSFGASGLGASKESAHPKVEGMAATTQDFDRMVPAAPDNVGALRRELRRWARREGAPAAVQANVALAFSEACTTIIGPDAPAEGIGGPLIVQARRNAEEIAVRVSHPSPRAVAPQSGGYGFALALMARICDRFEVRRRDDGPGTAVLMTFRLESEPAWGRSSPRPL